jgi:hypothetical protein
LFQNLFNRYSRAEITDEEDKVIILKIFKKAVRPYKPEENKWWINITLDRKFRHREVF